MTEDQQDLGLPPAQEGDWETNKLGKLKIFFGYAAGVGKTYAMLEAAHVAKASGVDVVAGYIEPHTRPETLQLLDGLEVLPPLQDARRGISLREFDLDAALSRRPQLILVDELAHTNGPGCRHKKRYQDVEELLKAGIDVYTTVNVQHIESLNDIVASITGIVVRERIPDSVIDQADQMELVDIEPADLIRRLEEGKVYRKPQVQQALGHFFTEENLIALREIALRRTADHVNKAAEKARRQRTQGAYITGEHILVCLSASPSNSKVIRTAARMADAFHGALTALFVETPKSLEAPEADKQRLRDNVKLAEQLGARIATVYGDDVALQIAEYAKAGGVSKIVIGRSLRFRRRLRRKPNLVDRMTVLAPDIDVYVIPDLQPVASPTKGRLPKIPFQLSLGDTFKTIAVLVLTSLIGMVFFQLGFSESNIITVYILGVLFTSVITKGWLYGCVASLLNVLIFNFLFTEPRFTLMAYDSNYPLTFLVMLAASLITSSLTLRVQRQAQQSARKAYRTEVLLETSQKLQQAKDETEISFEAARQIKKLLGKTVLFYPVTQGQLGKAQIFQAEGDPRRPETYLGEEEKAVAQWVVKNNKHAGATTNTLPGAKCLYLAVRSQQTVLAVTGIAIEQGIVLDPFDKSILIALLGEWGLALEKEQSNKTKNQVMIQAQQEQLRANLLRAISHDLRTPLTSISGNAGVLLVNSRYWTQTKKQRLYADIYDDSMWLINLVENLLSVTRIENGTMNIRLEPELLEEVIQEALRHVNRRSVEHHISVSLKDDLLMAKMDSRLILQVIINIVDNAIKYTQVGSNITIKAYRQQEMVAVEIADDGKGISDEAKEKLFDMFFTADNRKGDSRRGLGLGLSLCKSIINAHGGEIWVRDNQPHGAIFCFTLPAQEVDYHE